MKFCDNPECPAHVTMSYRLNRLAIELPNGERRLLDRNEYRLFHSRSVLFFCDICRHAITMTQEVVNPNQK